MNKAKTLTNISIIVGLIGVIIWLWDFVALGGTRLTDGAIVLLLIAIWLKLGAIYHKS